MDEKWVLRTLAMPCFASVAFCYTLSVIIADALRGLLGMVGEGMVMHSDAWVASCEHLQHGTGTYSTKGLQ